MPNTIRTPEQKVFLAKLIRDQFSIGLTDAVKAIAMADEVAGGDIWVGIGWVHASQLAISVANGRDGWNLRHGREMAERWKADPDYADFASELDKLRSPAGDTGLPEIDPCTECSLSDGHASAPITYLEESERDPEDESLCVTCPGCLSRAEGQTPSEVISTWNLQQREKLTRAREYLATLDDMPIPPAP